MVRYDGRVMTLPVLLVRASREEQEVAASSFPAPATRGMAAGRAILDKLVVHIHDVRADPAYTVTAVQRDTLGYRTASAGPPAARRRANRRSGHVAGRSQTLLSKSRSIS